MSDFVFTEHFTSYHLLSGALKPPMALVNHKFHFQVSQATAIVFIV